MYVSVHDINACVGVEIRIHYFLNFVLISLCAQLLYHQENNV